MYLKKIELFGFKSFADRTSISFEPGMTAIIGPNGCGKSNISDAMRWVLGEKSAKMLRGGKMEDLIFAGTEDRKPLGFAEVSLTISNEDKLFPIEYEEVVLTRRLYRSGESEYYLNKTLCRLKDIQDLIMNTGVGSNAYSMVEQGQIDYIVQAKADQRRFLIEEAAGISKYKNKKEEALRKLDRTEINLQRVNDIINEIEKNIKYAERQAKRAERFRKHFDELKKLELAKAHQRITHIENEINTLKKEKSVLAGEEQGLVEKLSSFQKELQSVERTLREHEAQQHQLEEERYRVMTELTAAEDKQKYNAEKVEELTERNNTLTQEVGLSFERVGSYQVDLNEKKHELEKFYHTMEEERGKLNEAKEKRDHVLHELEAKKGQVEQCRNEVMELSAAGAQKRNEHAETKSSLVGLHNKKESAQKSLNRLRSEEEEILRKIELGREEVEAILHNYTSAKSALDDLTREKKRLNENLNHVKEVLMTKRGLFQEIESKIKTLDELAETFNPFKEGTRLLLEENQQDASPYYNKLKTVLDTITVQEGYEHAIQAALAECLYALVVDSYDDALGLIRYVEEKEKNSIDVFINACAHYESLPMIPAHSCILGQASTFVSVKEERFRGLEETLRKIIVVTKLSDVTHELLQHLGQHYHIVSKNGDVFTRDGVIKSRTENEFLSGALVREEKKKHLLKDKELVEHELSVLSGEEKRLQQIYDETSVRIEEISAQVIDNKITLESNEKITSTIKENLSKIQEHTDIVTHELHSLDEEIEQLTHKELTLQNELRELDAVLTGKEEFIAAESDVIKKKEGLREEMQVEIASRESTCVALKEKEDYLQNTVTIVSTSLTNEEQTRQRSEEEVARNKQRIHLLTEENGRLGERCIGLKAEGERLDQVLEGIRSKRQAILADRQEEMSLVNTLNKDHEAKKDALHNLALKEVELEYQKSSLGEKIMQVYKVNIIDFNIHTLEVEAINFDTIEEDIQLLQKRVDSLGTVNLLAIDEYNDLRNRYTFLVEQKDDLENAKRALLEAVRKINRTTKQLFIDVFDQVQRNFQTYYTILFGGGVAELLLLDEENPLESGIEIMVRPPGKKLQNISLLSGGEKALTAIALLFALFKVKPSPFCVLDEVDAPLDEASIDRFLQVVQEFMDRTQFIIVTHSRKTIAMADTLFGVTMEDAGVSKIVSVRVKDVDIYEQKMPQESKTNKFNQRDQKVDKVMEEIFKEV